MTGRRVKPTFWAPSGRRGRRPLFFCGSRWGMLCHGSPRIPTPTPVLSPPRGLRGLSAGEGHRQERAVPDVPAPRRPRRWGTAVFGSGQVRGKVLERSSAGLHIGCISCSSLPAPPGLRAGMRRERTCAISGPSGRKDGQVLAVTTLRPGSAHRAQEVALHSFISPAAPGLGVGAHAVAAQSRWV